MKRDALDETRKNLLRLILGRVFHDRCGRITSCTHAILLNLAIGRQRWLRDLASRLNLCSWPCRRSRKKDLPESRPMIARGNSIIAGQRRQLDQIINQSIPSLALEPLHGTW
jgi:hypothetical protein